MDMPNWQIFKRGRQATPASPSAAGRSDAEAQELQLLRGVQRGRMSDFEALYRLYHPRLQRFVLHLTRQADLVDEILDDTLLVVWQRADRFDGSSKLSTWIFGIAYRKSLKALSRLDLPQEDPQQDEQADPSPGPEQQLGHAQRLGRLKAALGELSADHRAVIELCYFHDMSHAEIAQVVGCPPETVKTRMFYARRRLRSLVAELYDGPAVE
ncbi:sigma-70 family RNA polymerase sigma factor [Pelomonas sp. SE-A7]|uniref:RNA polymerase sigma factor n=1 Tax=Pelomonas sp. SE-A7 TaxID=3054953 RepID=UPI00259C7859|nr:sigma-70 family RNA polymerase sigma factor [Pelomonas sp. SE-A7]MDM4765384.1 sigma-70 family RNA polymerase sigma factor [Pelomonas sp. SE-A7]